MAGISWCVCAFVYAATFKKLNPTVQTVLDDLLLFLCNAHTSQMNSHAAPF